jgi:hypothetical protein
MAAALIAGAMGANAAQAATAEGVAWATTPLQMWAAKKAYDRYQGTTYRDARIARRGENKNLTYSQMATVPYQGPLKRKRQYNYGGLTGKNTKYAKKNPRHNLYNKNNDLDSKFCVLKKHADLFTDSTGDAFVSISCAELGTCPQWTYYSGLFNRYKLEWIKMTIHQANDMMVIYSYASLDNVAAPTTMDEVLKHANTRVHDTTQDRYAPGRTLKLKGSQAFSDYLETKDIGTDLGSVSGIRGSSSNAWSVTAGTKQAGIGFVCKGVASRQVQITIEFGVRFRGLNDAATTQPNTRS